MQNMLTNNPYYIGDAIIVMFGFSVLICHPPNLLDKFGEQIWRESRKKLSNLIFLAGGLAHFAYVLSSRRSIGVVEQPIFLIIVEQKF